MLKQVNGFYTMMFICFSIFFVPAKYPKLGDVLAIPDFISLMDILTH